jgi:hypothetical protein
VVVHAEQAGLCAVRDGEHHDCSCKCNPFHLVSSPEQYSLSGTRKLTWNAHAAFHTPDEFVIGNWVTPKVFSEQARQVVDTKGKVCRFAGKACLTVTIALVVPA